MTILEVPDIPPSPNVLKREYRNPHEYKRLRKTWEQILLGAPSLHHRNALREQAKKAKKLSVQITVYHARPYDPDNLVGSQKVVLDALVNIGFIAGDSPDKIELLPAVQVMVPRDELRTVVRIGEAP